MQFPSWYKIFIKIIKQLLELLAVDSIPVNFCQWDDCDVKYSDRVNGIELQSKDPNIGFRILND